MVIARPYAQLPTLNGFIYFTPITSQVMSRKKSYSPKEVANRLNNGANGDNL